MKAQRSAASSQALWKVIKSVFFIIDYIFDAIFLFETHHFMKSLWCCQNTKFVKFVNVKFQLKVEKLKIAFDSGCVNVTIRNRTCHIFLMNVIYMESQQEDFWNRLSLVLVRQKRLWDVFGVSSTCAKLSWQPNTVEVMVWEQWS